MPDKFVLVLCLPFLFIVLSCKKTTQDNNDRNREETSQSSGGNKAAGVDPLRESGSIVVFSARDESGVFNLYLAKDCATPTRLPSPMKGHCIVPVFSPDGSDILYAQHDGNDFELVCYNLKTGHSRILTDNNDDDYHPVWAPNGKRIGWSRAKTMTLADMNSSEIYVSDWPRYRERRLTDDAMADCYPCFTSDGKALISETGKLGSKKTELFGLFKADIGGAKKPLIYEPESSGSGIPHVHGDFVVFEGTVRTGPVAERLITLDLFVYNLSSPGKPRTLTKWFTRSNPTPRFSPDGKAIVCHRLLEDRITCQITVLEFDGDSVKQSLAYGRHGEILKMPRWNRNGTLIVAEAPGRKGLLVLDRKGNASLLRGSRSYRTQRFLELYNFDAH
ncbi:MAG: hypothetical protein KAV00_13610 [Phycisphaerae bacterium]|nr:hypothetical protein [Phycisphaerae bacterium]